MNHAKIIIDYAERIAEFTNARLGANNIEAYRAASLRNKLDDIVSDIAKHHPDSPILFGIECLDSCCRDYEAGEIAANALPEEVQS